jgi:AcrR family transcriptional regulator
MSVETKNKILDIVIDLIKHDHRDDELTLSKIAKRADIGKSTIYEYFKNKQDLIYEASIYLIETYEKKFLMHNIELMDFETAYKTSIYNMIEILAEAKTLFQFLLSDLKEDESLDFDERIKNQATQTQMKVGAFLKKVLLIGVKEGKITSDLTYELGMLLGGFLVGNVIQYVNGKFIIEQDHLIEQIYQYSLKILN